RSGVSSRQRVGDRSKVSRAGSLIAARGRAGCCGGCGAEPVLRTYTGGVRIGVAGDDVRVRLRFGEQPILGIDHAVKGVVVAVVGKVSVDAQRTRAEMPDIDDDRVLPGADRAGLPTPQRGGVVPGDLRGSQWT